MGEEPGTLGLPPREQLGGSRVARACLVHGFPWYVGPGASSQKVPCSLVREVLPHLVEVTGVPLRG